ncbi:MAG: ATP synthase F1 subunit epsilon [Candidatus Pacebacteria bacterium]|nr:ATP synthase F1 subunit epsilon [Candidatus Paceibacterota bacterium]
MASKKEIKFEIVTPEKTLMKEPVLQVTVPTESGEITVLPEHAPLVSILKPGVLEVVKTDNTLEVIAVAGGFVEVLLNKIVILADSADRASEIDEEEAEKARKRAEESLKNLRSEDRERFAEITAQLERELAKSRSVKRWRNLNRHIK